MTLPTHAALSQGEKHVWPSPTASDTSLGSGCRKLLGKYDNRSAPAALSAAQVSSGDQAPRLHRCGFLCLGSMLLLLCLDQGRATAHAREQTQIGTGHSQIPVTWWWVLLKPGRCFFEGRWARLHLPKALQQDRPAFEDKQRMSIES